MTDIGFGASLPEGEDWMNCEQRGDVVRSMRADGDKMPKGGSPNGGGHDRT
jgi:hypothetical protein